VASIICAALECGVMRSKRRAMKWMRKAAENGDTGACLQLACRMYGDEPYAREVGNVGEAAGVNTSAAVMEGHDVPPDVLTSVIYWVHRGEGNASKALEVYRGEAMKGGKHCRNDGCEVVGLLKEFKRCPQCRTTRYCGAICQNEDWIAGGHKETCGTATHR